MTTTDEAVASTDQLGRVEQLARSVGMYFSSDTFPNEELVIETSLPQLVALVDAAAPPIGAPIAADKIDELTELSEMAIEMHRQNMRNAARYRWMRDNVPWTMVVANGVMRVAFRIEPADADQLLAEEPHELDAAIDFAMGQRHAACRSDDEAVES